MNLIIILCFGISVWLLSSLYVLLTNPNLLGFWLSLWVGGVLIWGEFN